jgi:hypothetical protein
MIPVKFQPIFPCFAMHSKDMNGPVLVKSASGIALVVLTDEDLLRQYQQENQTGPAIRFDNPAEFIAYFDSLPQDVVNVAYDPGKPNKATIVAWAQLLESLLNSIPLPPV